ncbi:hypothetical protein C8J35_12019 [Rhizobium sp. PP-F2F-G38]|nr:hypothetical protein C8J37_12119 [Rhizobium sp. PP-WC-1G-195]PYE92726.1 hypothetical protein C8J35_12019 [Rhizobium sp. PP-F2F-G38]TCL89651.1 hypothetical protein C8J38_11118 [Rhizobium sp. PP-WC-2G-219]TCP77247.1 hypothetical protein C8J31_12516 [Rhizobium sp. PP-CC-2G-626]TCQ03334.1 hypothetical protein C8J34_11248 [Rhizobium sp. PP-F2F-G36]
MQVSCFPITLTYVRAFARSMPLALLIVYSEPTYAFATCPSKGDIGKPILLGNTSPFYASIFTNKSNLIAEQKLSINPEKIEAVSTTYFNPLLVRSRILKGSELYFKYKEDTNIIQLLHEKKTWNSELTLVDGGNDIDSGVINITFVENLSVSVGGCQYNTSAFRETIWLQNRGKIIFIKYYAGDIGLVVRATHLGTDGKVISDTVYDKIEIADTY